MCVKWLLRRSSVYSWQETHNSTFCVLDFILLVMTIDFVFSAMFLRKWGLESFIMVG